MREKKSETNILIVGSTTRKIVALNSGKRWVIGRSAEGDVDIIFDEAIVSRVHGEFYSEGEEWYYHDLKGQSDITIGMVKQNDIVLDTITSSKKNGYKSTNNPSARD